MATLEPGRVLDGKYQIVRTLGEGGMGVVYEALHLRLDHHVAVKCLLPTIADDPTLHARFEREARAAARLRSRHVVKILDVANDAADGTPYMVMELLRGHDLAVEAAAHGGSVPFDALATWITQVAEALEEAHQAGIVHRDLKPANIFLSEESERQVAKILDFGIAKSAAILPGITYAAGGGICGTPHYMSPEQITAGDIDARSDIWSLAVVAYEMLAGHPPFDAQAFTALAVKIVNDQPIPLGQLRPDLPSALCDAIMRGMTKSVSARPATMEEFGASFAPFGDAPRRRTASASHHSVDREQGAAPPWFADTVIESQPRKKRTKVYLTAAAIGVVLAAGMGGLAAFSRGTNVSSADAFAPAQSVSLREPGGTASPPTSTATATSSVPTVASPVPPVPTAERTAAAATTNPFKKPPPSPSLAPRPTAKPTAAPSSPPVNL